MREKERKYTHNKQKKHASVYIKAERREEKKAFSGKGKKDIINWYCLFFFKRV